MSDTLNPLRIEDFPELTSLLSTDQVILFSTDSFQQLTPYIVDLSALNKFALSAGALDELESKVVELEERYKDLEREFASTYMTPEQVSAQYSSIAAFDAQISKIEKTQDFKAALSSKADDTYLEYRHNALKSKCQDMKEFLGSKDDWPTDNPHESGKGYKIIMAGAAKAPASEE